MPQWKAGAVEEIELDYTGRPPGAAPIRVDDGARIARYGREHLDTFAGQWIEQDGSQRVAFTADIDTHRAALSTRVHAPERITVVAFRYTYRHLIDLTGRIPSLVGAEALATWGPDVTANKVVVRVLPDHADRVRELLRRTNPDDAYVVSGSRPIPA